MGQQIIKQPNGLFAMFSSSTDTIVAWDATAEEIVEWFADQAAEDARRRVRVLLSDVGRGEARRAYHQFAMTWEQALEADRAHGGDASRAAGVCSVTPDE